MANPMVATSHAGAPPGGGAASLLPATAPASSGSTVTSTPCTSQGEKGLGEAPEHGEAKGKEMGSRDSLNHRETVVHGRGQLQLRRANSTAWPQENEGRERGNAAHEQGFKGKQTLHQMEH